MGQLGQTKPQLLENSEKGEFKKLGFSLPHLPQFNYYLLTVISIKRFDIFIITFII